jgi:hypothetical protein
MPLLQIRIVVACLGLVALTRCEDPNGPLPRTGLPDELRFNYGGFAVEGVTVELQGSSVAMWRTPWNWQPGVVIDTVRVVPTEDQWRAFWTAAERAGVQHWRPRYAAEGVVDGNGWSLRLVGGDFRLMSTGSNAYPDNRGGEHELEMTEAFQSFRSALGNLVGEDP